MEYDRRTTKQEHQLERYEMIGDKLSKQDELTEMSERRNAPRT